MLEIKNEIIKTVIENKMIILMSIGFLVNSGAEYFLGNSKHKSLIGFLKNLMKKKDKNNVK
jgi:predicted N-acyltransferase